VGLGPAERVLQIHTMTGLRNRRLGGRAEMRQDSR
jgi:hypothetical protein